MSSLREIDSMAYSLGWDIYLRAKREASRQAQRKKEIRQEIGVVNQFRLGVDSRRYIKDREWTERLVSAPWRELLEKN